ncbi:MAG: hypothetical protein ABIG87_02925 [Patescibacteria group bacterium]
MKKLWIISLLFVFCFFSFIANATASDQKITGAEANQILTEQGLIAIFDESKGYTLLSSDWVFDVLTGNPFYGDEPYTVRNFIIRNVEDIKKANHCFLTMSFIEERTPNAAFGTISLRGHEKQIWGPLKMVYPGHQINFFITEEKEVVWLNPLSPNKIQPLDDLTKKYGI